MSKADAFNESMYASPRLAATLRGPYVSGVSRDAFEPGTFAGSSNTAFDGSSSNHAPRPRAANIHCTRSRCADDRFAKCRRCRRR